jgi:hypothetical protein
MDILYYDTQKGWHYGRLISHDGKTALVKHPNLKHPFRVSMLNVKAYRPEEEKQLKEYLNAERTR